MLVWLVPVLFHLYCVWFCFKYQLNYSGSRHSIDSINFKVPYIWTFMWNTNVRSFRIAIIPLWKSLLTFTPFLASDADGQTTVKFGVLFTDDRCANLFEALVGTLRAAKRKKVVDFKGELLLQGVHDNVDVVLLKEWDQTSRQITVSTALLQMGSRFKYYLDWLDKNMWGTKRPLEL